MDKTVAAVIITALSMMLFINNQDKIRTVFNLNPPTQLSVDYKNPNQPQNDPISEPNIPEENIKEGTQLESNGLSWGVRDFEFNPNTQVLTYTIFTNKDGMIKFSPRYYVDAVKYKDMPFVPVVDGRENLSEYNITFENNAYMSMHIDLNKYKEKGYYRLLKNFIDNKQVYHWTITFEVDDYGVIRDVEEKLYLGEKLN